MQQNVSPKVVITLIALIVAIVAVLAIRTLTAPSATPDPAAQKGPVNPYAGGGPTEEDLKRMREYNAKNPGAASSYR